MNFIGLDPGVSGGIAVIAASGAPVDVFKMPETQRDVLDALRPYVLVAGIKSRAALEQVSSSPQMGVVSAFSFGRSYERLIMALVALEIPFDEVRPAVWQKVLGCRTKGDKNVSKRRAQELFPAVKVTHYNADALLLAEYCRRKEMMDVYAATR